MYSLVKLDCRAWEIIAAYIAGKARTKPYLAALNEWCAFLKAEPGTPEGAAIFLRATELQAAAFKKWNEKQPGMKLPGSPSDRRSAGTIRLRLSILKSIYGILRRAGLVQADPFYLVKCPPKHGSLKQPTNAVPFQKVREMLEKCDGSELRDLRERAILCVLLGAGLRRSEVVNLAMSDIQRTQRDNCCLLLRGTKNKTDAKAVLPRWAAAGLLAWVRLRKKSGAKGSDPVFVSGYGKTAASNKPIGDRTVNRLFKRHISKVELDPVLYSAHSARATAITKLCADGVNIRAIKDFGRFASIEMADHYIKDFTSIDEQAGIKLSYAAK